LLADGSPHVTPMWIGTEDDLLTMNTVVGRVKYYNLRRDPRVAISLHDQRDPYARVIVQGRVIEVTEDGAVPHIHELARKYLGHDFPLPPGQTRVVVRIEPRRVTV
ncbi:MAG: TIGR03618 family F420-dependent PPOX class oxidoreductase, partial [Candidatus Thermoplasmatota archaeon]|nr:TIGR03618 family F420-dependent PPOX class oxidoreductase [Candidatus Thermoplasmatota archaeon]